MKGTRWKTGNAVEVWRRGEDNSGIYELCLINETRRNAMGEDFWNEFPAAIKEIGTQAKDARVLIISSKGSVFSAGIDLTFASQYFLGAGEDEQELDTARRSLRIKRFVQGLQEAFNAIEDLSIPVIAAISGGCVGAAVDLICACDIRIASTNSWFTVKEVDLGLAADLGTLQRLPRIVGNSGWVRDICYTARIFGAEEAFRMGLIGPPVETQDVLMKKCYDLAAVIASKSPVAIVGTKYALNYSRDKSVKQGLNMQSIWNSAMLQTTDVLSAFARSGEKQKKLQFANL